MPNKLERLSSVQAGIACTNSASTTARIPFSATSGATIALTAVATAVKIAWHVAMAPEGTPVPLYNADGAVETTIAVDRAYAIPDECFAAPFLVPVLDAGTATLTIAVKG